MIRPHARVVGIELDNQMPVPTQHMYIATERIRGIVNSAAVPVARTLRQDELRQRCVSEGSAIMM